MLENNIISFGFHRASFVILRSCGYVRSKWAVIVTDTRKYRLCSRLACDDTVDVCQMSQQSVHIYRKWHHDVSAIVATDLIYLHIGGRCAEEHRPTDRVGGPLDRPTLSITPL